MSVHVAPVRNYLLVFAALMVLTAITVGAAFMHFGPFNNVVAMAIAVTKATLVVLFFMHVKYSTRLTKLIVVAGFFWLGLMFLFTFADYMSRGWLGVAGK
jgi:cytochrome c oxidase subunit 4